MTRCHTHELDDMPFFYFVDDQLEDHKGALGYNSSTEKRVSRVRVVFAVTLMFGFQ